MPASTFKVFYDTQGGFVTRWVVRNGKNENDDYSMHVAGPGETALILPMAQYGDLHVIQARVNAITGKDPRKSRYAILDQSNKVVEVVESYRDPTVRDVTKSVLKTADENMMLGATKVGGAFVPPPEYFAPKLAKWPPDPVAEVVEKLSK